MATSVDWMTIAKMGQGAIVVVDGHMILNPSQRNDPKAFLLDFLQCAHAAETELNKDRNPGSATNDYPAPYATNRQANANVVTTVHQYNLTLAESSILA